MSVCSRTNKLKFFFRTADINLEIMGLEMSREAIRSSKRGG